MNHAGLPGEGIAARAAGGQEPFDRVRTRPPGAIEAGAPDTPGSRGGSRLIRWVRLAAVLAVAVYLSALGALWVAPARAPAAGPPCRFAGAEGGCTAAESPAGLPEPGAERTILVAAYSASGLLWLMVGTGVAIARPGDGAARLLLAATAAFAASRIFGIWAMSDPSHPLAVHNAVSLTVVLTGATVLHLFLAFPAPHPVLAKLRGTGPPALRPLGGATAVLYVVPLGIALFQVATAGDPPSMALWNNLLTAALLLATGVPLARSYRRPPTPQARAQVKWIVWSLAPIMAALVLGYIVPDAATGRTRALPRAIATLVFSCFPVAVAFAVLRYRLFDIDLVINRTLVYGALTVSLGLSYWSGVVLLQQVLLPLTGGSTLAVVGTTLLVAALFRPLRNRIQAAVDRRFFRRKYDAAQTLAAFSAKLREEIDLDSVSVELVAAVRDTMGPTHVSLWLRTPGPRRGAEPEAAGPAVRPAPATIVWRGLEAPG